MSEIEIFDVADILCNPGLHLKDLKRFLILQAVKEYAVWLLCRSYCGSFKLGQQGHRDQEKEQTNKQNGETTPGTAQVSEKVCVLF